MGHQPPNSQGLRLTLQYLGKRFDGHTLSCADAQDMAVFQRMLVKIADHRIKGSGKESLEDFSVKDTVYFGFEHISKGSAVVEISVTPWSVDSRAWQAYADFGLDPVSCVKDAFRVLMGIFQGSQNEDSLEYFKLIENDINDFGKNLKIGESVRFVESKQYTRSDVVLDLEMKRELSDSYSNPNRVVGIGVLDGFQLDGVMFLRSEKYGAFDCKIPKEAVKARLDGHIGSDLEFVLTADLNYQGEIKRVRKCHYFRFVIEEENKPAHVDFILKRVDEFMALERGWLDGEGEKIDLASITTSKKFIEMTSNLAHEYIVAPNPEGFSCIEFVHEGWKICIDFLKESIRVFGYDMANRLDRFERHFKKLDSTTVEFASTAGGNINAK